MQYTRAMGIALGWAMGIAVAAGAPLTGSYKSPDLGVDMLNGRWSEGFNGGGLLQSGNVLMAASWDGVTLGGEWSLSGSVLDSAAMLLDTVSGGSGVRIYDVTYAGGVILLSDEGPWWSVGDPGAAYLVQLAMHRHTVTIQYAGGLPVDIRATVSASGDFVDWPGYAIEFIVATSVVLDSGGVSPSDYPAFGAAGGHWGVIQKLNMQIVPEPGVLALLALGAPMLLRRRR